MYWCVVIEAVGKIAGSAAFGSLAGCLGLFGWSRLAGSAAVGLLAGLMPPRYQCRFTGCLFSRAGPASHCRHSLHSVYLWFRPCLRLPEFDWNFGSLFHRFWATEKLNSQYFHSIIHQWASLFLTISWGPIQASIQPCLLQVQYGLSQQ